MANIKIKLVPVTVPVVDKVTFTPKLISAKVTENKYYVIIIFWLERNDTKQRKKFQAMLDNTEEAINSIELVGRESVERTWEYPVIKYKDRSKTGGYASTLAHQLLDE